MSTKLRLITLLTRILQNSCVVQLLAVTVSLLCDQKTMCANLTLAATLHWLPVKSSFNLKSLSSHENALKDQTSLFLKPSQGEHFAHTLQAYPWFLKFLKA